jgi:hypothetical protein
MSKNFSLSTLSKFRINHHVSILIIGSDTTKLCFYQSFPSNYMSNLDVRTVSSRNKMSSNLWNVKPGITNQNRYFNSDVDLVFILHDLEKSYNQFEKSIIQKQLVAKGMETIVFCVYKNDENKEVRKKIVKIGKFCLNNDIQCSVIPVEDIGDIIKTLYQKVEEIRLMRKEQVNLTFQKVRQNGSRKL